MPAKVGDTVRFKGFISPNGVVTATQVGKPVYTASGIALLNPNPNSNSNGNASEGEDHEVVGVIQTINGSQITVNGLTYIVPSTTDLSMFVVGNTVKIEFTTNADGTMTITEVKSTTSIGENDNLDTDMEENSDGNSNGNSNSEDDQGEDEQSNGNGSSSWGGGGDD